MNYPFYTNNNQYYMQSLQDMRNNIDNQMRQLQNQQQNQPQQPTINQSFQLAPQTNGNGLECKYVNNIDEVKNTFVMKTGIFLTKDFNNLWVKNVDGSIKTFKTEEVIELDSKDKEIQMLKKQIEEMKGMMSNANEYDNTDVDEPVKKQATKTVSANKRSNAK